jgi:RAB6A-GEF complex partner protein 1
VLLQPSKDEQGALKYEMKVVASNVEYFSFMRDHNLPSSSPTPPGAVQGHERMIGDGGTAAGGLGDSLWYFDGHNMQCWPEFEELLGSPAREEIQEVPPSITIGMDFYPLAIILNKAVVVGLDPEISQRRSQPLAHFRLFIRVRLTLRCVWLYITKSAAD